MEELINQCNIPMRNSMPPLDLKEWRYSHSTRQSPWPQPSLRSPLLQLGRTSWSQSTSTPMQPLSNPRKPNWKRKLFAPCKLVIRYIMKRSEISSWSNRMGFVLLESRRRSSDPRFQSQLKSQYSSRELLPNLNPQLDLWQQTKESRQTTWVPALTKSQRTRPGPILWWLTKLCMRTQDVGNTSWPSQAERQLLRWLMPKSKWARKAYQWKLQPPMVQRFKLTRRHRKKRPTRIPWKIHPFKLCCTLKHSNWRMKASRHQLEEPSPSRHLNRASMQHHSWTSPATKDQRHQPVSAPVDQKLMQRLLWGRKRQRSGLHRCKWISWVQTLLLKGNRARASWTSISSPATNHLLQMTLARSSKTLEVLKRQKSKACLGSWFSNTKKPKTKTHLSKKSESCSSRDNKSSLRRIRSFNSSSSWKLRRRRMNRINGERF